ncbi:hypothetical protein [Tolypothrix sp. PCC 7601]|uniref:hypothetical protein n=1 Tax=Tolypothrix sp. PCC 7601 TaxID=1188 RepID=UPI0021DF480E|nr:hypothetical protein [Tolypothrix sp. PCC 7601]UYD38972.1 hypothetical protein HG267_41530 [Tolypothrix sp. PCC 7601]
MRAKFIIESVNHHLDKSVSIKSRPVLDGSEENKSFSKYTPYGNLEMKIDNPNAVDFFIPGAEYYLDFTKVEV